MYKYKSWFVKGYIFCASTFSLF